MQQEPKRVAWPVRTLRDPRTGNLYISVDCLMNFRNMMGPAGWPQGFLALMDHIIREAQRSDAYGKEIGP